jgi:low temperature requirement protein LtrA
MHDDQNLSFTVIKMPHHSQHHHRQLFKAPTIQRDEDFSSERKATWSELFFDVFFVPVWMAMAHRGEALGPEDILESFVGFLPIWGCWKGATLYSTRFDTDDIFHRVMLFIQMCAMGNDSTHAIRRINTAQLLI